MSVRLSDNPVRTTSSAQDTSQCFHSLCFPPGTHFCDLSLAPGLFLWILSQSVLSARTRCIGGLRSFSSLPLEKFSAQTLVKDSQLNACMLNWIVSLVSLMENCSLFTVLCIQIWGSMLPWPSGQSHGTWQAWWFWNESLGTWGPRRLSWCL